MPQEKCPSSAQTSAYERYPRCCVALGKVLGSCCLAGWLFYARSCCGAIQLQLSTSAKLSPRVHQQGRTYQRGCTHTSFGTGLRAQIGYCNYLCSCALGEDVFLDQNVSKASAGKEDNLLRLYPPSVGKNGVFHSPFGNFGSQCFQQLLYEAHAGILSLQSKDSRSTVVSSFLLLLATQHAGGFAQMCLDMGASWKNRVDADYSCCGQHSCSGGTYTKAVASELHMG